MLPLELCWLKVTLTFPDHNIPCCLLKIQSLLVLILLPCLYIHTLNQDTITSTQEGVSFIIHSVFYTFFNTVRWGGGGGLWVVLISLKSQSTVCDAVLNLYHWMMLFLWYMKGWLKLSEGKQPQGGSSSFITVFSCISISMFALTNKVSWVLSWSWV